MFYFNLAMVAKQYWCLSRNTESLEATVLKARYFPRGNIDSTTIYFQPSFLWMSIIKTRELVREGSTWQVCDSTQIRYFKDRWIRMDHRKILTIRGAIENPDLLVVDLRLVGRGD